MNDNSEDRRHFHRIIMHRPVLLRCQEHQVEAQLLDISLKGALVSLPGDWTPTEGNQALAQIRLTEDDQYLIELGVTVAHVKQDHVGLEVNHIDLDSATTLRRLIELNLADPVLLERELEQLTHAS